MWKASNITGFATFEFWHILSHVHSARHFTYKWVSIALWFITVEFILADALYFVVSSFKCEGKHSCHGLMYNSRTIKYFFLCKFYFIYSQTKVTLRTAVVLARVVTRFKACCYESILRNAVLYRSPLGGEHFDQCIGSMTIQHFEEFWKLLIYSGNPGLECQTFTIRLRKPRKKANRRTSDESCSISHRFNSCFVQGAIFCGLKEPHACFFPTSWVKKPCASVAVPQAPVRIPS
jgi:hypothetical protein